MPVQLQTLYHESCLFSAWSKVKAKGSMGGIDGMTIAEFEKNKRKLIPQLVSELKAGTWNPLPYLEIEVAKVKNPDEKRKLGMTALRDKIVQHAIKSIIEPRYNKLFLGNSYAYRPGKGVVKAIRRAIQECRKPKYSFVLQLDVDNFFDSIDHEILQKRLLSTGAEAELVRLIMLCVQMGKVKQGSGKWFDNVVGIPQGAILSPILSNLYLHSFDQFAVSRGVPYIRFADDILFFCESKEEAEDIFHKSEIYLKERLKLSLNKQLSVVSINEGFDFLGVTIFNNQAIISEHKRNSVGEAINCLEFSNDGLTIKSKRIWDGISNYYAKLLPQEDLEYFDSTLVKRLTAIIHQNFCSFTNKTNLQFALKTINFLSLLYQQKRKDIITEIVAEYTGQKHQVKQALCASKNRKLIQERKKEFRKKEAEASGLLISKAGTYVGLTSRGVTVSLKGKHIAHYHPDNLSQIVIIGQGISLSSNLTSFCMKHNIPIDIFDTYGVYHGSFLSSKYVQNTLWLKQAMASIQLRNSIAISIIEGKIKNQHALLKYFNKYHKKRCPELVSKIEKMEMAVIDFKDWKKQAKISDEELITKLMGHEAQVAICYWDYIRELVSDDNVAFDHRVHQGATDLINTMLNYGYAILYARVWQALLAAHLNPYDSLIHVRREGKPALVYDMVEVFRSQAVDRIVISLVQKGQNLEVRDGLLTDKTKQLLVKSIMERFARYERFQGEEMKMEQILLRQAKLLAKAFDGTDKYKPYVAKW